MIGQAIADGFLTGAILALGAIGVSLGSQILKFANFSHSELLTWGAYLALTFTAFATAGAPVGPLSFGWPLLVAVVIAGLLTGVLALIVDRLVFRRLRSKNANSLTMVFASFGIALVLRNLVLLLWGPGGAVLHERASDRHRGAAGHQIAARSGLRARTDHCSCGRSARHAQVQPPRHVDAGNGREPCPSLESAG